MAGETRQVCTFFLDGVLFGVEVEHVCEVLRVQHVTRVPLAPPEVEGLINLRGQIVTAVDVRRRLGLPERAEAAHALNVVVQVDESPVSLIVDDVGDVLELEAAAFEPPPDAVAGVARDLVRGAYKLPDRLLLSLDVERLARPRAGECLVKPVQEVRP
jgi:purine-binding chemotaxis protein CheW